MPQNWKTLEVIVSVRARGEVNAKDLSWHVQTALQKAGIEHEIRNRHLNADFGRMEVKQRNRVEAAEELKALKARANA